MGQPIYIKKNFPLKKRGGDSEFFFLKKIMYGTRSAMKGHPLSQMDFTQPKNRNKKESMKEKHNQFKYENNQHSPLREHDTSSPVKEDLVAACRAQRDKPQVPPGCEYHELNFRQDTPTSSGSSTVDPANKFANLTRKMMEVAAEMRDSGRTWECFELCAKLGISIGEDDINQDVNNYKEKHAQANQEINKTRSNDFNAYKNPMFNDKKNDYIHANTPPVHQNLYNNFTAHNQFPPQGQFHNQFPPQGQFYNQCPPLDQFQYQYQNQYPFPYQNQVPLYNNINQNFGNSHGGHGLMNVERMRQFDFSGIMMCPYPIPNKIRTAIPKFTGSNAVTGEAHCKVFDAVIEDFGLPYEDVKIRLFMQSLIEDARDWFRTLPDASIRSLVEFKSLFLEQYGDHNIPEFALHEIISIKKEYNESVVDFNKRFNRVPNKIPNRMKPVPEVSILYYINAYDSETNYELRTRNPKDLQDVMKVAIIIENNRKVAGKVGKREDTRLYNPKAPKANKDEDKLDKVLNALKYISVRVNKTEKQQYYRPERPRLHDMPYNTTWKDGKPVDRNHKDNQ